MMQPRVVRCTVSVPKISRFFSTENLALILLLAAGSSSAVELGDIRVYSQVGEPLRAEIPLRLQEQERPDDLVVKFLSGDILNTGNAQLQGQIRSKDDGSVVIQVDTTEAIKETVLDFELELSGATQALRQAFHLSLSAPVLEPLENKELTTRLDRIEQTLTDLQHSLQNRPDGSPAVGETRNEAVGNAPEASPQPEIGNASEQRAANQQQDIGLPPVTIRREMSSIPLPNPASNEISTPPQENRSSGWIVTILQISLGIGIALMGVALGLLIRRRPGETRLTVKIAVKGQRRPDVEGWADNRLLESQGKLPEKLTLIPLPESPNPADETQQPEFLDAADYGLVSLPLISVEPPTEGSYPSDLSRSQTQETETSSTVETSPSRLRDTTAEVSGEKTIDDILRELTGQTSFPEVDPISTLCAASGDYTRDHTIEQAMKPGHSESKAVHAGQHIATDYADLTDMDELETLLDLARAYMNMEEFNAARELLLDVLARGTPDQQIEATKCLEHCPPH